MVSVIIPVYNREKTVKEAIKSVLEQTWNDLEVIVVDDGSTDKSADVIKSLKDERVKYIYQENAGACAARNHGIELAKGEYIAFHDSDDIWHMDKLSKQMQVFKEYDPDIVFCKLNQVKSDGTISQLPMKMKEGFLQPVENLFEIGTQTIIAKKNVFDSIRFDKSMPRFQEFELLYRAAKEFSIYCLDEGLVNYYIGQDSISNNPYKLLTACEIIMKKHPEIKQEYPQMASAMAHNLLNAAQVLREQNNKDWLKIIKKSLECKTSLKILVKSFLVAINRYNNWKKLKLKLK